MSSPIYQFGTGSQYEYLQSQGDGTWDWSNLIGGWSITADTLYSGTGATYIGLKPGTGIWLGDEAFLSAPFSVDPAGVLHAHSGTIGGWYLGTTEIKSDNITADSNVLLDQDNGLIRIGPTGATYITIDGANRKIFSSDYVSGPLGAGFGITTELSEFQNIRARGKLVGATFEKDTISAVGGNFLVADSDILNADMTADDTVGDIDLLLEDGDSILLEDEDRLLVDYGAELTILGDTTFSVGDILRIRDGIDDEWFEVLDATSAPIYAVVRDKAGDYSADTNPIWTKGTTVVNFGSSGDGVLFFTASEVNAPYIDVITHAGEPWTTLTTHMRMGNLNGFLDYATDNYGVGIGDTNSYLKYDPTNGLQIGIQEQKTVFDAYGIRSYNTEDELQFQLCNGSLTAYNIKLQDPASECNYSYLSAGALQFHDKLGPGVGDTGDKIILTGWTSSPEVSVGIKSLMSYNAASSAASQKWDVYHTTPECFSTTETCYGYCFNIHALLTTYASVGAECVKSLNFGETATTEACTCANCVRMKFQLWCNNAAPSNYYAGTICYALCYRVSGAETWCVCCYSYVQPSGSAEALKTTNSKYDNLEFPCMETWEIMACQVSIAFADTGICATESTICCFCCARTFTGTLANAYNSMCIPAGAGTVGCTVSMCCCVALSGSNPTNTIYCTIGCACVCTVAAPHMWIYGCAGCCMQFISSSATAWIGMDSKNVECLYKILPTSITKDSDCCVSGSYNCSIF